MSRWDLPPDKTLAALMAEWREAMVNQVDAGTVEMYATHCRHLCKHFPRAENITKAGIADYSRARLGKVIKSTVQKERSTLNGFLEWALEQGHLLERPEFPTLPKRAVGTAAQPPRRVTVLTPEQARALIAMLPQWSSARGQAEAFPVRSRFVVAHETALRPATLDWLSVPEHYTKGAAVLIITDEIDKARFGRELPLTDRARAALDAVAPREGLIFGDHDYRYPLERAAEKALPPELARTFSAYDFRHSRATEWVEESGDIAGTAYLLGHKQVTTTNRYAHPGLRAGRRVLDAASGSPTGKQRVLVGDRQRVEFVPVGAKKRTRTSTSFRTLEPESSAPTNTVGLEPNTDRLCTTAGVASDPWRELSARSHALLRSAAAGEPVDNSTLYAFARLVMASSEMGRLALSVLDGGAFAPTRAVELAQLIVSAVDSDEQVTQGGGSK